MSTQLEEWPELDSAAIAERLRAHMGARKITRVWLSKNTGIQRTMLAAKLDGKYDFTIADVQAIARAISKSWLWVLTGDEPASPPPPRPPGHPVPATVHTLRPGKNIAEPDARLVLAGAELVDAPVFILAGDPENAVVPLRQPGGLQVRLRSGNRILLSEFRYPESATG